MGRTLRLGMGEFLFPHPHFRRASPARKLTILSLRVPGCQPSSRGFSFLLPFFRLSLTRESSLQERLRHPEGHSIGQVAPVGGGLVSFLLRSQTYVGYLADCHAHCLFSNVAQQQYDLLPVDPFEQDRRDLLSSSQAGPSFRPEPTVASFKDVEPAWRVDIDSLANLRKAMAPPRATPLDLLNAAVGRDSGSAGRQAALRGSGREVAGGGKASAMPKDNRFYFTYLGQSSKPTYSLGRGAHLRFALTHTDKADNRVLHKTQSRVKLLGDGFAHHKIELYASQSTHAFVRSNVVQLELAPAGRPSTAESTMFGWLPDDEDAPEMAVGLSRPAQVAAPSVGVPSSILRGPPSSSAPVPAARLASGFSRVNSAPVATSSGTASARANRTAEILALATNRSQSNSAVASSSRSFSLSATSLSVPPPSQLARPTPLGTSKVSNSDLGPHQRPRSSVQVNSIEPVNARASSSTTAQSLLPKVKPIVWHAGSYEIVLLMDHRERSGKQGEQGAVRLQEMGVNAETCNDMVLGDIMWVARRTDGSQEGGVRECVLDYIIERKRLDDLVHSIRDGRYREQKVSFPRSIIDPDHLWLITLVPFLMTLASLDSPTRASDRWSICSRTTTCMSSRRTGGPRSRRPKRRCRSSRASLSTRARAGRGPSRTSKACTRLSSRSIRCVPSFLLVYPANS